MNSAKINLKKNTNKKIVAVNKDDFKIKNNPKSFNKNLKKYIKNSNRLSTNSSNSPSSRTISPSPVTILKNSSNEKYYNKNFNPLSPITSIHGDSQN